MTGALSKNIFADIPHQLAEELIESLGEHNNVRIERIISRGHTSPESGWYDQDQNEWVIVLQGEAELSFADGTVQHMKTGDYINIEAHQKHRVAWTAPETATIWLAIHY